MESHLVIHHLTSLEGTYAGIRVLECRRTIVIVRHPIVKYIEFLRLRARDANEAGVEAMNPKTGIIVVAIGLFLVALVILRWQRRANTCRQHSHWSGVVAVFLAWSAFGSALILILLAAFVPLEHPTVGAISSTQPQPATTAPPDKPLFTEDSEDDPAAGIVGVWTDNYQGKRTMTLRDDGTGTMEVELSGVTAKLFAERLRFDMRWSMRDDRLIKESIGGEPREQVELILRTMGRRVEETILEVSADRLKTLDPDGVTSYVWTRLQ